MIMKSRRRREESVIWKAEEDRNFETPHVVSYVGQSSIAFVRSVIFLAACSLVAAEGKTDEGPADHLPAHITQVTWFGERADWSRDGKKILFLTKTFGDAMELDVETRHIRNL